MKRRISMGPPRLIRRRARGQSIPLIAVMILVLVAMVGLSVDVGNTFAEERKAVSAANAAAIAGMNTYLLSSQATTSNRTVATSIEDTLKANGVDPATSRLEFEAFYLDAQGAPLAGNAAIDINDETTVPSNVAFIEVRVSGRVDTFFARVVSRPDLPVNAKAYAGTCPVGSGVYPIAIPLRLFNGDVSAFNSDTTGGEQFWIVNNGSQYDGLTARRIVVGDTNTPGGFSWLQWLANGNQNTFTGAAAGSARETEAAMSGSGTLPSGLQEVVPWPGEASLEPEVYPEQPGVLNPGDWVRGNPGYQLSSDMRSILDSHIANETQLILPIYRTAQHGGANAEFHITRLGLFVLLDYGRTQNDKWIEVVYLGDAELNRTACAATPPERSESFDLVGNVQFSPVYPSAATYQPSQIVVVLDVSGSMNANFAGLGYYNGSRLQCTNGPPGTTHQNCGKPTHAYDVVEERRIYIAKNAIELLVSKTNMPGNANYDPNLPKDEIALVWFNKQAPTGNTRDFRSDPQAIINDVMQAGAYGGDPYKTEGGTNGAAGLYRAGELLQNEGRTTTEFGREWTYKPVVIFITDGVSNHFLKTNDPTLNGGSSDSGTYPSRHRCRELGILVAEDAACQTNEGGDGRYRGQDRPITEMINVSGDMIKNNRAIKGEVYVLALSNIPETGLDVGVASTEQHFAKIVSATEGSDGLNEVDRVMLDILDELTDPYCRAIATEGWQDTLVGAEFAANGQFGLSYPTVGKVTIRNPATNFTKTADIKADGAGRLRYEFIGIPRATYELTAFIMFKHTEDQMSSVGHVYSQIYRNGGVEQQITVVVDKNTSGGGFNSVITEDIQLMIAQDANVCARPE